MSKLTKAQLGQAAIGTLESVSAHYDGDPEAIHVESDRIIIELLCDLGMQRVVDKYNEIRLSTPFWYS